MSPGRLFLVCQSTPVIHIEISPQLFDGFIQNFVEAFLVLTAWTLVIQTFPLLLSSSCPLTWNLLQTLMDHRSWITVILEIFFIYHHRKVILSEKKYLIAATSGIHIHVHFRISSNFGGSVIRSNLFNMLIYGQITCTTDISTSSSCTLCLMLISNVKLLIC